jgi:hypothetical protein
MKAPRLILVRLYAKPRPRSRHAKKCGGAYVNCWVDFKMARGAEVVARDCVEREGWEVKRKIAVLSSIRKDCKGDKQLEAYFNEALKYGVSIAFYCHPPAKAAQKKK